MMSRILSKTNVLMALLFVFLLIGSVAPVQAFDRCSERIHKAERNLQRAIRRHGLHSVQAEREREKLERVRERCHRRY